jgi:uncharacterized protein
MTQSERALMPDYLRLFALFGIVVVNVQYIAFSALHGFVAPVAETQLDTIVLWLVNGLALLKSYGLFSFMFGVGLGFLMRSAERRNLRFGRIYRNRMIGLLVLGILHGCLFFPGDILVIYAITGSILYLFRNWSVRRLVQLGAVLLLVQLVIAPPAFLASPEMSADIIQLEQEIMKGGSFLATGFFRTVSFGFAMPTGLILQGTAALGWFCLGLAAVKSGMIDNAAHPLWQRARRFCLLPGVALSLAGSAMWQWGETVPGVVLTICAAPLATFGYLGLIAALSRAPGPIMTRLLAAGGSSLSIYLGQSLILSTIFSNYGMGLWEGVDRMIATLTAVVVTIGLIIALSIWRIWFRLGPFEWILRCITYAGTQSAVKRASS